MHIARYSNVASWSKHSGAATTRCSHNYTTSCALWCDHRDKIYLPEDVYDFVTNCSDSDEQFKEQNEASLHNSCGGPQLSSILQNLINATATESPMPPSITNGTSGVNVTNPSTSPPTAILVPGAASMAAPVMTWSLVAGALGALMLVLLAVC